MPESCCFHIINTNLLECLRKRMKMMWGLLMTLSWANNAKEELLFMLSAYSKRKHRLTTVTTRCPIEQKYY